MRAVNEELHQGADGKLYEYARLLRQEQTAAEDKLWQLIKNKKMDGLKFRRQHPLDKYIADFYCHEKRLVIELDGEVHNKMEQKMRDKERTFNLNQSAITVLRFSNEEVLKDSREVINKIINMANRLPTIKK